MGAWMEPSPGWYLRLRNLSNSYVAGKSLIKVNNIAKLAIVCKTTYVLFRSRSFEK